jgi:MFS family permease
MQKIQHNENIHSSNKIWTKDFSLIVFANFFIFLGFQMTLPTIPLYLEKLGGNDQLIGLVIGIFTFSALVIRPIAGHALESKGRAFVYLTGIFIFILSVGSYAIPMSIFFIFMIRIIQGVGWGLSTTASGTIATDFIPVNRRGEGLGYYGLAGNLSLAFGPSLGLTLAGVIPFNILFIICASLGVAAFILSTFIKYKPIDPPVEKHKRWDLYEKSAIKPSALILFITVTFGGIATFLPLYTIEKGVSGIQLYFLLYAAALMVARAFSGRIYDKKGHLAIFIPGSSLILIAMLLLAWLPNNGVLFTAAIIYGLGFGSVQPALQAWSVEKSEGNRRGMANATFYSFFDLGIGLGAIIFGQISYFFGYQLVYIAAALSVFLSILIYISLLILDKREKNDA